MKTSFGTKWLLDNQLKRQKLWISYDEITQYKQSAVESSTTRPSNPDMKDDDFLSSGCRQTTLAIIKSHLQVKEPSMEWMLSRPRILSWSGCDTVFATFGKGKTDFLKLVNQSDELKDLFTPTSNVWGDKDYIGRLSVDISRIMYTGKKHENLGRFCQCGNLAMQFLFLGVFKNKSYYY